MDKYIEAIKGNYGSINEHLYNNLGYIVLGLIAVLSILIGLLIKVYDGKHSEKKDIKIRSTWIVKAIDRVTNINPLGYVKNDIKTKISITLMDDETLNNLAGIILMGLLVCSSILIFLFRDIGELWYVKVLLLFMSVILPHYIFSLAYDYFTYFLEREFPKMIDEYRSAFISENKIRPALKECSKHVKPQLGRILVRASESKFTNDGLLLLKSKFNNMWLNIFVTLLINYKDNGGDLIEELYALNRQITRHKNYEKKKNRRLILYELFAACAAVASVPAVILVNQLILGNEGGVIIDAQANLIISKIIAYSILALLVIRVLRKVG